MNTILTLLQGRRTYLAVVVGLAYLAGAKLGYWQIDSELMGLIGFTCAAFLRAAIANLKTDTTPVSGSLVRSGLQLWIIVGLGLCAAGCTMLKTTVKVPVYVLTKDVVVDPKDDQDAVARNRAYTLWDGKDTLANYKTDVDVTTNRIQITIGFKNLSQESSGSNVVGVAKEVGGAAGTVLRRTATGN